MLTFQGTRNFRIRLALATLSGKPIKIEKVRSNELNPGLTDYEISILRLLETLTNGSKIEISYTGTTLIYYPGLITGGTFTHNCPPSKSVGYFIELVLYIAPFAKKKINATFKGLTSSHEDYNAEGIRFGLLPILEKFGVRDCQLHILKRGFAPTGEGEVKLIINSLISTPLTLHALESSKFVKIKGIAYCCRVSPSIVNRLIDSTKQQLKRLGCEIDITADVWRGESSGKSPGFGLMLYTDNKKNWRIFSEDIGNASEVPEDLSTRVVLSLLENLENSKIVGSNQLGLVLIFMLLGKEDLGRLKISKHQIDENLIWLLRDIKQMFGIEIYMKEDEDEEDAFIATVKGAGFTNTNKKIA
ncbi:hypothetical protein WICMUC_004329 [Wickerhamomyces mucosus]|uniref:RNA 3'-terminal phosphate cyclase-like protein n=1 Tax=Wickerhamomyces mucosus TaxID=1378264 RepID=A0A9P8PJD4_9ASCO|nr:hypothetical protein WICMUC_004329 [Wickerhamomyces mucosus]